MKKVLFLLTISLNSIAQTPGSGVTDIDGNQYATVIIGTQEWMAENLRTTKFSDGSLIPNVTTDFDWSTLTSPGWCWFQNDQNYDIPYGKLYNYWVVVDPKNVCPSGWHAPSGDEWGTLFSYAFGTSYAGGKLKSTGDLTSGTGIWKSPNTEAIDQYGFRAVPGEYRYAIGYFPFPSIIGAESRFWKTEEYSVDSGYRHRLLYNSGSVLTGPVNKREGMSIRCIKGSSSVQTIELQPVEKQLLRVTDLMGRETEYKPNTVLIYIYSDGTTERILNIEP